MDISIVVPLYNEAESIVLLHNEITSVFSKADKKIEIIYVNDGSSDESMKILNQIRLRDDRVRLLCFDKNYGQTAALDAGLKNAKGNFILTIESDLTYKTEDLLRVLKELENNDAVIGYRSNRLKSDGFMKFASSRIANWARNKVLNENFKDAGCFLRGVRRECLDKVTLYKGLQVFLISLLNMHGYKIKEIEITSYPRKYGKSKYNIRNRLFRELFALFVVKWMKSNLLRYKIKDLSERPQNSA